MSARETHWEHINSKSNGINSMEEGGKLLNSLAIAIQRECEKRNYACICFLGLSELDEKTGRVVTGYRGKKHIEAKENKEIKIVAPHIHAIILANPGEMLAEFIREHLREKTLNHSGQTRKCDHYLDKAIPYVLNQSSDYRVVICNVEKLPFEDVDYFCKQVEKINFETKGVKPIFSNLSRKYFEAYKTSNEVFTKVDEDKQPQTLLDISNKVNYKNTKELLCNNNIYNNIYKYINNLYKLYKLYKLYNYSKLINSYYELLYSYLAFLNIKCCITKHNQLLAINSS